MRFLNSVCVCLLIGLSACETITPEQRRALDEQQCRSYGFRPRTDAFAECLQRIDLDRRAQIRAAMDRFDRWDDPIVVYRPVIVRRD
ncbi:hypothetical protein [Chelativorans sp.]|uniref:hypothetical protein n=1 Tax=Chelativorans sp. TaxID=2203393 RepID=UPI0028109E77|nr:hypothetical protein [Chelativorans sp.]